MSHESSFNGLFVNATTLNPQYIITECGPVLYFYPVLDSLQRSNDGIDAKRLLGCSDLDLGIETPSFASGGGLTTAPDGGFARRRAGNKVPDVSMYEDPWQKVGR